VNEMAKVGLHTPVIAMLTQSVVAATDPAMQHPTKPIGPFYSRQEAEERRRTLGWQIVEDASRGYRRIVPSPDPIDILELDVIRDLTGHGVLVIACGGGGIPVVRNDGKWKGIEAVIDKDRASALLAAKLGVSLFVISTDTDYVYLDYKKSTQRPLTWITASDLQEHLIDGQFPAGNMGPKIESVLRFLRDGGKEAIITSAENLSRAVRGDAGTHILPDESDLIKAVTVPDELSMERR